MIWLLNIRVKQRITRHVRCGRHCEELPRHDVSFNEELVVSGAERGGLMNFNYQPCQWLPQLQSASLKFTFFPEITHTQWLMDIRVYVSDCLDPSRDSLNNHSSSRVVFGVSEGCHWAYTSDQLLPLLNLALFSSLLLVLILKILK